MSTSSTVSVTLIPTGKRCQRTLFSLLINMGQALSSAFMNANIIVGLLYEQTNVEPMVVQKLDAKAMLLLFLEGEEVEKMCGTL